MSKIAMISQPMRDLDSDTIDKNRIKAQEDLYSQGFDSILNTYFECPNDLYGVKHESLYFLSRAIDSMSKADAVYFCKGWEDARGCKIEHEIALEYGLETIYEK